MGGGFIIVDNVDEFLRIDVVVLFGEWCFGCIWGIGEF